MKRRLCNHIDWKQGRSEQTTTFSIAGYFQLERHAAIMKLCAAAAAVTVAAGTVVVAMGTVAAGAAVGAAVGAAAGADAGPPAAASLRALLRLTAGGG